MSELNGNTPSEKLNQLLDGELSESQESQLFSELSLNDELRSEMRDLIAIKNTVRSDTEAFVPPVSATAAVFEKAGFNIPGAYFAGLKSVFVRYSWIPILLALLTGYTTFSIMSNNNNRDLAVIQNNLEQLQNKLIASQNNIAELSAENSQLKIAANKPPEIREVIKYVKVPVVSSKATVQDAITSNSSQKNDDAVVDNDVLTAFSASNFTNNADNVDRLSNLSYGYVPEYPSNEGLYSPVSNNIRINTETYYISLSGMLGATYPQVAAPTPNEISNFRISMLFLTSNDDMYIGMEAGREPFSQQFYNVDRDNKKYLYEQRPNVWWAGASLMSELGNKIDGLLGARPFGKILIGATELGPLGKVAAGLNWKSDAWGLGTFIGLEGSFMGYQNQGQWYLSQKLGIIYGMSIQF